MKQFQRCSFVQNEDRWFAWGDSPFAESGQQLQPLKRVCHEGGGPARFRWYFWGKSMVPFGFAKR
jgi:hypothetical protein